MRAKLSLLFALVLMLSLSFVVCAAPIDMTAIGSITVTIRYQDNTIGGGTLTLMRVADVQWVQDHYTFLLSEEFADAALPLTNLNTQEAAKQYAAYADDHQLTGTTVTVDQDGVASFSDLSVGLYLITRHVSPVPEATIAPFLVTVPLQINGETVYDVDASPKVSLMFTPSQGDRPDTPNPPGDNTPDNPDFPSEPQETTTTEATFATTAPTHSTQSTNAAGTTHTTLSSTSAAGTDSTAANATKTTNAATKTTIASDADDTTTPTTAERPKIPQTGQLKWPIPLLAFTGMLLIALGWRLVREKDAVSR